MILDQFIDGETTPANRKIIQCRSGACIEWNFICFLHSKHASQARAIQSDNHKCAIGQQAMQLGLFLYNSAAHGSEKQNVNKLCLEGARRGNYAITGTRCDQLTMKNDAADGVPKIRADFMPFLVKKQPLRICADNNTLSRLALSFWPCGRRAGAAIRRTNATLSPPLYAAPNYSKFIALCAKG